MARIFIEVEDYTKEYMDALDKTVQQAIAILGTDLQSTAQQAAPEKTTNLRNSITVQHSMADGAYQADLESTAVDPETGRDYVDWMHNGKYRLGAISRKKSPAQSKIGKFRKNVGRQYLQGSGAKAKAGYSEYMMKQIDNLNSRFSS